MPVGMLAPVLVTVGMAVRRAVGVDVPVLVRAGRGRLRLLRLPQGIAAASLAHDLASRPYRAATLSICPAMAATPTASPGARS